MGPAVPILLLRHLLHPFPRRHHPPVPHLLRPALTAGSSALTPSAISAPPVRLLRARLSAPTMEPAQRLRVVSVRTVKADKTPVVNSSSVAPQRTFAQPPSAVIAKSTTHARSATTQIRTTRTPARTTASLEPTAPYPSPVLMVGTCAVTTSAIAVTPARLHPDLPRATRTISVKTTRAAPAQTAEVSKTPAKPALSVVPPPTSAPIPSVVTAQ